MSNLPGRERHQKLAEWLKAELLAAGDSLNQATPPTKEEALERYRQALFRFSHLVLDDELPRISRCRPSRQDQPVCAQGESTDS